MAGSKPRISPGHHISRHGTDLDLPEIFHASCKQQIYGLAQNSCISIALAMEILQFCTKPSICKIQCNSYSPFSCSQCFMTSHKVMAGMNSRCSRSPFGSCNATTTGSSLAAVSGSAATNSSLAWLGRPENRNGKVRSNTFRPCLQQYSSNVSPNGLNCKTCLFHLLHTQFIIFNRLRAEQNGPPLAENILKFICLKKTYLFEENSFPRAHEKAQF